MSTQPVGQLTLKRPWDAVSAQVDRDWTVMPAEVVTRPRDPLIVKTDWSAG